MVNSQPALNPIQKCIFLLFISFFISCEEPNSPDNGSNIITKQQLNKQKDIAFGSFTTSSTSHIDKNIRSIFQDRSGTYWFGTNATGVYRYDGRELTSFTVEQGLSNNQVQSIQEDNAGNMWFGTGGFGVSKFDGQTFTTFTNKGIIKPTTGADQNWKIEQNDLWFYAGGGAYRYRDNSFVYLPLDQPDFNSKQSQNSPYTLSRYAVYSLLKDTKGNIWFGTQAQGACCYNGKSFTWFTEKGLGGSAVLGLFEDHKGNIWFGNNGSGLFRYDGKSLINFTEEKGLGNKDFKVSGKSGPGTLARVYAINEDNIGNLWIGTVDAGVWKYDGTNLTNYTTREGLTSNAVNTIYKDKKGELWFGTDEAGICTFNGRTFTIFEIGT